MNVSMNIARELNFEDKYLMKESIGEGGHAYVKRALNKQNENVAVKICRSGDPEIVKTFIETYKICRILNFPSVLKCHEIYIDEETETLILVMEYCGYPSLQRLLK
jgi:serine/threonine protein kinase